MASKKIYTQGNYLLIDKGDGNLPTDFALINTTAQIRGTLSVVIKCSEPEQVIEISQNEILIGDWFQEDGITAWDFNSLVTFLRENTGFNPASGGSGAGSPKYKAVISLSSDGEQMTNEVLFNNFPEGAPEINQITTGISVIDFIDGNPIPQKIDCGSNITESNDDMWRFSTAFDGIEYKYYQGKSEDGGDTWAFGDFNQTNDDALFCIITFEYYE